LKIRRTILYAAIFTGLYFTVNILLNWLWNFHQLHNDYWDLLFIAKNINFANAFSLANPCIPIGYTSLLHFIIRLGSNVTIPIVVNLLFGSLTIFASLLFYQKVITLKIRIISALFLGIFPLFFFYSNQGGADPGSVMFFTGGAFLLLYSLNFTDKVKWSCFFTAGVLLGLGAIFRYHVLVGGAF
jgi:Dolichyl-phosphate-mannose-protein mannosyltransferase